MTTYVTFDPDAPKPPRGWYAEGIRLRLIWSAVGTVIGGLVALARMVF